jgi:pimeloyl-ACP methyl ester carboxylesterase
LINMQCVADLGLAKEPAFRIPLDEIWPQELLDAAHFSSFRTDACGTYWNVRIEEPVLARPVTSDIPTLIIVGALDPETPPPLATSMAKTLSRSTVMVLPNAAHAAMSVPSQCANTVVAAFLGQPEAKPDVSCAARLKPRFSLPGEPIKLGSAD